MRKRPLALLLLLILPALGGCAVESPFSLNGKPKLAGPRCSPTAVCGEVPAP
ncbi:MAG: hypothetical protein H0V09_07630 [Gemmatimonadetes bacterium]|nr:hypothetical protein [Gemmatimonadota bacterium]